MKTTKENKMWIITTSAGVAFIGRDPKNDPKANAKAQKGRFWLWASSGLGYPPIFKDKAAAQKFARKIRRSGIAVRVYMLEAEFYKNEMVD